MGDHECGKEFQAEIEKEFRMSCGEQCIQLAQLKTTIKIVGGALSFILTVWLMVNAWILNKWADMGKMFEITNAKYDTVMDRINAQRADITHLGERQLQHEREDFEFFREQRIHNKGVK